MPGVSELCSLLAIFKVTYVKKLWCVNYSSIQINTRLTICTFSGDFLQRTSPKSYYRDSWPSLFIAPAGLTSELHVDSFGSNFWMALLEGKKRSVDALMVSCVCLR